MVERSKLNVITSRVIITTMGIATAGLLAWRNLRRLKQTVSQVGKAVAHPVKTINTAVQKTKAGFAYVRKQVTNSKIYKVAKQIVTHPVRTGKQLYRKTVSFVRKTYRNYTPKPVQRFNRYVKRTVSKRYNSARKSVSRFVKNTRTRVKKFFRRKRR